MKNTLEKETYFYYYNDIFSPQDDINIDEYGQLMEIRKFATFQPSKVIIGRQVARLPTKLNLRIYIYIYILYIYYIYG